MNLHIPRSIEAETELRILSRASNHILSAQKNAPINGIVQDGLIAVTLLTMNWGGTEPLTLIKRETALYIYQGANISKDRIQNFMKRAHLFYPEFVLSQEGEYEFANYIPGTLFISIVFPENFRHKKKSDILPDRPYVKIKHGIMRPNSAPLCKNSVGGMAGSCVHSIAKDSPQRCLWFLSDIQQVTDRWLCTHGFSIGIEDCLADCSDEIQTAITKAENNVIAISNREDLDEKAKEYEILIELNNVMSIGPKIAKNSVYKGQRNALNIARISGAKGSVVNLAQIVALLGQQNIKGGLMTRHLTHNSRCHYSFLPNEPSPEARGFIKHNYIEGLTPEEFFFHAAAGREGIISTAIRTAETGYIQKKISRKTEESRVWIDGSVRDSNGRIISFMYGDDGLDAKLLVNVDGLKSPFFVDPIHVAKTLCDEFTLQNKENLEKRLLSPKEIKVMQSYINFSKINTPVIQQTTKNTREILKGLLQKVKIYEDIIPEFFTKIRDAYETTKAAYGMMVGLLASSSIGEPGTQMALNAFHFTGKGKDEGAGISKYKQLINVTKSKDLHNAGCTIYFNNETINSNAKIIRELNMKSTLTEEEEDLYALTKANSHHTLKRLKREFEKTIVDFYVSNVILRHNFQEEFDPIRHASPTGLLLYEKYEPDWWVEENFHKNNGDWVITLQLNVDKLFRDRLDVKVIAKIIQNKLNSQKDKHTFKCVSSPNLIGTIDIYIPTHSLTEFYVESTEITSENTSYLIVRDVLVNYIKEIKVSGIDGIKKVYIREDTNTNEFVMDTDGINFMDLFQFTHKGVDPIRTICDDTHIIKETLGIEAGRKFMLDRLTQIIHNSSYINKRHIALVVDTMTCSGDLTAASRDGISRDVGPNAKIMFEKSVDNASIASLFGETDTMDSLASTIMYGKVAKAGVGMVKIRDAEISPVGCGPETEEFITVPVCSMEKETLKISVKC